VSMVGNNERYQKVTIKSPQVRRSKSVVGELEIGSRSNDWPEKTSAGAWS
jgi:hypothetical protein